MKPLEKGRSNQKQLGCLAAICILMWIAGGWIGACSLYAAEPVTPLFDNLGQLHHPITTSVPLAQQYFDQGLRLSYGFNHEEAVNSFEQAAALDRNAAMAYWGVAFALGPNINMAMTIADERRAYSAIKKAKALAAQHATLQERAYIEALAKRYGAIPGIKRAARDEAYSKAMREVARAYPQDADATTLFAESLMDLHPWDYWTDEGRPKPWAEEIVTTLERVLEKFPDHPGACHFYIHAVEASSQPERALPCARRLPDLMPGAGHLVHMPAHIYMRTGRYQEAVERNAQASSVDHEYLAHQHLKGIYPHAYYPHNLHFLSAALSMEGRGVEAIRAARDLATTVSADALAKEPRWEFFATIPVLTLVRFGRWDEILSESAPQPKLQLATGMWRFARGLALTATGRLNGAEAEARSLAQLIKKLPKGDAVDTKKRRTLLQLAERVLAGEIANTRGRSNEAIRALTEALGFEAALPYAEPPPWLQPVRHNLGAVLLEAGKAAEAEAVFRDDLARNPENGWALYGLAASLRAQNKNKEAESVAERFKQAWARADVTLSASRIWTPVL